MTGKTHAGMGAAVGIALSSKIPGELSIVAIVVIVISALLPDIDHPKSIFNKYILPVKSKIIKIITYGSLGIALILVNIYYSNIPELTVMGVVLIIVAFSSHRTGFTHSIIGMIIFAFLVNYMGARYNEPNLVYYFVVGYSSHVLGDMCTNRGVPLFYPLRNKNIKFPFTFRVGSSNGKLIEDAIIVVSVLYIVYRLPMLLQLK
ncbi:metal-dependent hydrolase [Clostridium sp.]|jgi:inner membrane protein|uniref:metal-dependent hydrolase n=1 Tax=Clostridium sp. TaxID=1506 RepID=UPI0025888763|nr:metal-dependent hydrolase [Clostridium sp.]MDF2503663.1 putative rane-bound metal-dependent hydrolase [Clostridium sp.]